MSRGPRMIGAVVGAALGTGMRAMRFRATYLHVPTSSKLIFTVEVLIPDDGSVPSSAWDAMGWRAATKWMQETGLATHEWVRLGIVGLTDKMSVQVR